MAMLVDNQKMETAFKAINDASQDFGTKATAFITDLTSALSTFEGETKDVLIANKIGQSGSEVEGTLAYFVEKQIPDLIKGLADLLDGNRKTIDDSDQKLAEAIKGGGNG